MSGNCQYCKSKSIPTPDKDICRYECFSYSSGDVFHRSVKCVQTATSTIPYTIKDLESLPRHMQCGTASDARPEDNTHPPEMLEEMRKQRGNACGSI